MIVDPVLSPAWLPWLTMGTVLLIAIGVVYLGNRIVRSPVWPLICWATIIAPSYFFGWVPLWFMAGMLFLAIGVFGVLELFASRQRRDQPC